jgi:hypothetical protein
LLERVLKPDAVYDGRRAGILSPLHNLNGCLALVCEKLRARALLAEVHQDLVDRHPVEPCGEGRLAPEHSYLVEELQEHVLRHVFGLGRVAHHAEREGVDAPVVAAVKLLESFAVAAGGLLRQLEIGRLRLINFCDTHFFIIPLIIVCLRLSNNSARMGNVGTVD